MSDSTANHMVKNSPKQSEKDLSTRVDALFCLLGTDVQKNIRTIVSQARDIFGAEGCVYLAVQPDGNQTVFDSTLSKEAAGKLISLADQLLLSPREEGFALLSGHRLPRELAPGFAMAACMPVKADGATVGMLMAGFKTQREFSPDDRHAARCLSNAMGLQHRLSKKFQAREHQARTGRMARQVAHDLNNILAGLVSYPELILMQMEASDPFQGPVSLIHDAGLQAAEMVADFLLLARPGDQQEFYRISPSASARAYCQTSAYTQLVASFPLVRFAFFIDPDLPDMPGTDEFIPRIFTSLLHHSAQNLDGPGQITVTFKESRPPDAPQSWAKEIFLRIEDNGPRTDEKDLGHLFEPFYAKKTMGRQGTGLGLAAAKKLICDQGGSISAYSHQNRGTRFDVRLKAFS